MPAESRDGAAVEGRDEGVAPTSKEEALPDLPSIESIGATTDIRAFLAPGVPAQLTRAALRRAWVADPNIRDFVGLAETAWDFNAPDAVPGFGPLLPAETTQRMLAELAGQDSPVSSLRAQPERTENPDVGAPNEPSPPPVAERPEEAPNMSPARTTRMLQCKMTDPQTNAQEGQQRRMAAPCRGNTTN